MAQADRRGVALGGFMGTGKTTVGARLAERLGLPFVDMDAELAERFGELHEQFARDGEQAFRLRESALVSALCDGVPRVVATGGGAWVSPGNRARLRQHYHTVVLEAPLDVIEARIDDDGGRPLWKDAARLLESRRGAYAEADLHVDTSRHTVEEVVDLLVAWLRAEEA